MYNGTNWVADSIFYNNGSSIGVGTTKPSSLFQVNGLLTTKSLSITGGSDLAEPFDVKSGIILPGMVLSIDIDNPGKLKVACKAYDRT